MAIDNLARGLALRSLDTATDLAAWTPLLTPVGTRNVTMGTDLSTPQSDGVDTGANFVYRHNNGPRRVQNARLRYVNWYLDGTQEVANPYEITVRASIKIGTTYYPLYKDGARDVVIAAGEWADFDPLGVEIPPNTNFYSYTYVTVASGDKWPLGRNMISGPGDRFERGTSITDKTTSGTVSGTTTDPGYGPHLILGDIELTNPVFVGIGDSIMEGIGGGGGTRDAGDSDGNVGWFERLAVDAYPWLNLSRGSMQLSDFVTAANRTRRMAELRQIGTHVVLGLGRNDYAGSRTAEQILADYETAVSIFAALKKKVILTTLCPTTTSTDSFFTTANQTIANAGKEAVRLEVNAAIRAGAIAGVAGYLDVADQVETARDSGIWKANGTSLGRYTSDGIHPRTLGHQEIAAGLSLSSFV